MYDIKIEEVFNGFIVTIGCQRFVFGGSVSMAASRVELQAALTAYLADREGTEKAWSKRFRRPAPTTESIEITALRSDVELQAAFTAYLADREGAEG